MVRSPSQGLVAFALLLAACTAQPASPPEIPFPSPTSPPTPVPSPVSTLAAPATEISEATRPTPEPEGGPSCLDGSGRIIHAELVDPELPRTVPYRVFLPQCSEELQGELPALYLLHGLTRTDAQWDELGADEIAEELIRTGRAPPFLIVMPWERRGLDFEATVVEYLIPHMEDQYGASPNRRSRAIGGISRGGGWALRIGLRHPDLFAAIGLHSPAVLIPDLFEIPRWVENGPVPGIWIDIGDRDSLRLPLADLLEVLDELAIDYEFSSFPGEHTSAYWSAHTADYLSWYVTNWE